MIIISFSVIVQINTFLVILDLLISHSRFFIQKNVKNAFDAKPLSLAWKRNFPMSCLQADLNGFNSSNASLSTNSEIYLEMK